MESSIKHAKTLKVMSIVFVVFNILYALASFLAIVSGLLLLFTSSSSFFSDVSAEAAAQIQHTYAPLTLLVRLGSAIAYSFIIVHCLKNRSHLPQAPDKLVELPYLVGLVITPVMFGYNLLTAGGQLNIKAFIFPLIFVGLYAYALKLTKELKQNA